MVINNLEIEDSTLVILDKLKSEFNVQTYDEVIGKLFMRTIRKDKSMAGSLAKYCKGKDIKGILKELQEDRRKGDRF